MELFHFLRPGWLLLLPLVPVLVLAITRRGDNHRKWRRFVSPHLLNALLINAQPGQLLRPLSLLAVWLVLAVVSLAGPTWQQQPSPFTQDRASLVIVLKVTPSMLTEDLAPSRLDRAVYKIRDVLSRRSGANTALIAYAGSSHLVVPLTRDANIINTFAEALLPEIMPEAGDEPGPALVLAQKQLSEAGTGGSILWIGDDLPTTDAVRDGVPGSPGAQSLLMLGVLPLDFRSAEHLELQKSAAELKASLTFITPDAADVDDLTSQVEANFFSVAGAGLESIYWQDQGYWLLLPLIGLALFWFRAGWVVRYQ